MARVPREAEEQRRNQRERKRRDFFDKQEGGTRRDQSGDSMTESASGVTSDLASREVAEHAARMAADLLASGRLFQTEQTAIRGLGALLSCARVDQGRVADLRLLLASCYFLTRRHAEAI